MSINFPNSPSLNQLYTYDNKTWEWNGIYWEVYSALTSYITSAYTSGDGVSNISGISNGNIVLKSFSGFNINIVDSGNKLTFSASTSSIFTGGTVTGNTIFTNNVTATTISATTILADNIQRTLYRLPASVACPPSTTTTAFTLNIPRSSVFSGQTLKVEGIITANQPTAANKTVTCIWGTNTGTPQNANMGTTSNAGSFGFLARVTQTGVYYGRQSIYSYSNQSATAAADVGSNITVRIEVNPSTSAATVDHIVVTIY